MFNKKREMKALLPFSSSGRRINPKQALNVWKRQGAPARRGEGAVPWDEDGSSHSLSEQLRFTAAAHTDLFFLATV